MLFPLSLIYVPWIETTRFYAIYFPLGLYLPLDLYLKSDYAKYFMIVDWSLYMHELSPDNSQR